MHALRAYIQEQMDARGWKAVDLVRESGLSKQTISVRLKDNRDRLAGPLEDETVDGLARAFRVDRKVILVKVGEALGLPMGETVTVYSAEGVSNEELLKILAKRLGEVGGGSAGSAAPMNQEPPDDGGGEASVLPLRGPTPAPAPRRAEAARRAGRPANAPDTTTGEESQDPGGDEPS